MDEKLIRYDEINPYFLTRALVKNIWVIILLCASTLLAYSARATFKYKPCYTSSATFMVSSKDSTSAYNSLTATQSMATVFAEVFQSNVLRDKIEENMTDEPFDGTIQTATIPETNLLIVSVTASAPDTAFRALQLIIEHYSSISDYIFSNAQLEVIRDPVIPVTPVNPLNPMRRYPMLLTVSAFLSIGAVLLLHILRDTVQTPKAARRKLDARMLRTVRHEVCNKTLRSKLSRKKISPLINRPLISKGFIADNLSLCSAVEYHARKRKQQILLITSAGENEGKSTVAANLALSLARKSKKVVLLDCDFRKPSMHMIFENPVPKDQTFSSYLLSGEQGEQPNNLIFLRKHGITVGLSHPNSKHMSQLINNGRLAALLDRLRRQVDYIILDTPPMLVAADTEALARLSDTAVMVVRSDYMQTSAINDCLDNLRKSAPEVCGIVLNNHHTTLS